MLNKVLDEFVGKFGSNVSSLNPPVSFPVLAEYLAKYQNPKEADSIMKVQKELDETKIILASVFIIIITIIMFLNVIFVA